MVIETKGLSKNVVRLGFVTALILLVPFVAMQLTDQVVWTLSDFVVMGILLFGTGLVYELIKRAMNGRYRVALAVGLFLVLLVIWAELAVGVFGTPFAGS